jgi:hypothetical protein
VKCLKTNFGKVHDVVFNIIKLILNYLYILIKLSVSSFCALLPFIICITIGVLKTNLLWFVLSIVLEVIWLAVYVIKR